MTTRSTDGGYRAPGRLGDPDSSLRQDDRAHPALVAALRPFGMDGSAPDPTTTRQDPDDALIRAVQDQHDGFEGFYEALPNELPGDDQLIEPEVVHVPTPGGDVRIFIYRVPGAVSPSPGLVYIHGGGMSILTTDNKVHRRWCTDLARTGMTVIGLDFRNAHTGADRLPFPAGLDDCASVVQWISARRDELGITKIVLQGESGGGNLVLATVLMAKRDGFLDSIDGAYATVPYISGGYAWDDERKLRELPSLLENDGYFLNCQAMDLLVHTYDPDGAHAEDPLCWPYFATEDDLAGLPPHVISVNEVDPLRDEGIAYFRKLARAGVPAIGRVNLGLVHAAESIFRQAVPDSYWFTIDDIRQFADRV